jgi:hypothetical protein
MPKHLTDHEVSHSNALPKGFRLQEYLLDTVLGQGGFGITYLARDTYIRAVGSYYGIELVNPITPPGVFRYSGAAS